MNKVDEKTPPEEPENPSDDDTIPGTDDSMLAAVGSTAALAALCIAGGLLARRHSGDRS